MRSRKNAFNGKNLLTYLYFHFLYGFRQVLYSLSWYAAASAHLRFAQSGSPKWDADPEFSSSFPPSLLAKESGSIVPRCFIASNRATTLFFWPQFCAFHASTRKGSL